MQKRLQRTCHKILNYLRLSQRFYELIFIYQRVVNKINVFCMICRVILLEGRKDLDQRVTEVSFNVFWDVLESTAIRKIIVSLVRDFY